MKNRLPYIIALGATALLALKVLAKKTGITDDMKKSYFTIKELCASQTAKQKGIDNTPTPEARRNLQALIDNILDPARKAFGKPIYVNSGYRSPELNAVVGGSSTSDHKYGRAADIRPKNDADFPVLFEILAMLGNYDQLIWEHPNGSKWIHVSYNPERMRAQILDYNGNRYADISNNWYNVLTA